MYLISSAKSVCETKSLLSFPFYETTKKHSDFFSSQMISQFKLDLFKTETRLCICRGLSYKFYHFLKSMLLKCTAAAKSLQSCLTLCDPIDGSPPGFPIPGILQARTLEWVAISFSNA